MTNALEHFISPSRLAHSERVSNTASLLAKHYNPDLFNKAKIAGYYHDCAKQMTPHLLHQGQITQPQFSTALYSNYPAIWHAFLGPTLCEHYFQIHDSEILNAIKWHATGHADMSLLEKIVYVADFIEPGRKFPFREDLYHFCFTNLDEGVLAIASLTMIFLIKTQQTIHPETLNCRDFLIKNGVNLPAQFTRWMRL